MGLVVAVVWATPGVAQTTSGPRVTAAFGVGRVNPLPVDFPYTGPTWSAAVQVAVAKHIIVEGVAAGWRHTTATSSRDEARDPRDRSGQTLLIRQSTTSTREGKDTVSLNALATATLGRVRFTSGGGAGLGVFKSRTAETVTVCTGYDPDVCDPFTERFSLRMFSMQCVLGVDVAVTSRLQAFVAYRLSQPFNYGLGEVSVLTGLKVRIK
jgi:opacity protein-like surface antigen